VQEGGPIPPGGLDGAAVRPIDETGPLPHRAVLARDVPVVEGHEVEIHLPEATSEGLVAVVKAKGVRHVQERPVAATAIIPRGLRLPGAGRHDRFMRLPPDVLATVAALKLARAAVELYVSTGRLADPPDDLPPPLREPGGVFVTLRRHGRLRGCIGTLWASHANMGQEIVACAVAAAVRDPRFPPIGLQELPALSYEVDVVGQLEAVGRPEELDPRTFGVVVEHAGRRGVLLPDLDGVDTVDQQLAIARRKAGLAAHDPVTLYRFRVRRYVEPGP
jgi:AmmeMemoRadiSam system protein A